MKLVRNFNARSFSRIIWKNAEAKYKWEDKINKLGAFVSELEILSVVVGHRPVAWQTICEKDLVSFSSRMYDLGLLVVPIKRVAKFDGFAHKHEQAKDNQVGNVCVIVTKEMRYAKEFKNYLFKGDNIGQGRLLGYPECCCAFFDKMWKLGYFDPIWQAAENTPNSEKVSNTHLRVSAHSFSNPVFRYSGIRAGFHIPCSFRCEKTISVNEKRMKLAWEVDWKKASLLKQFLKYDSVWSVLNGIGQVETADFFLIFQSVPVYKKYVVEIRNA